MPLERDSRRLDTEVLPFLGSAFLAALSGAAACVVVGDRMVKIVNAKTRAMRTR